MRADCICSYSVNDMLKGIPSRYSFTYLSVQGKATRAAFPLRHTFDLFGEFNSVGVGERARLLVNVVNVQDLTHELDDWLGFIKRCG